MLTVRIITHNGSSDAWRDAAIVMPVTDAGLMRERCFLNRIYTGQMHWQMLIDAMDKWMRPGPCSSECAVHYLYHVDRAGEITEI